MTYTQLCRKNLYQRLGIHEERDRPIQEIEAEISRMVNRLEKIFELAKPRLIMGGIRYGSNWKHESLMDYMQLKFSLYRQTGNFEVLVDFAAYYRRYPGYLNVNKMHTS